jgi:hypothetical protein
VLGGFQRPTGTLRKLRSSKCEQHKQLPSNMEQYSPLIGQEARETSVSNTSDTSDEITLKELPLTDYENGTSEPSFR